MDNKIVDLKDINVLSVKADNFPEGIGDAFIRLESKLPSLKGRKFYGTLLSKPEGAEYRACIVPLNENEISALAFEPYTIPGGKYCKTTVKDWENKTNDIKIVFNNLAQNQKVDNKRPQIEFYKSQKELILFLPVI